MCKYTWYLGMHTELLTGYNVATTYANTSAFVYIRIVIGSLLSDTVTTLLTKTSIEMSLLYVTSNNKISVKRLEPRYGKLRTGRSSPLTV